MIYRNRFIIILYAFGIYYWKRSANLTATICVFTFWAHKMHFLVRQTWHWTMTILLHKVYIHSQENAYTSEWRNTKKIYICIYWQIRYRSYAAYKCCKLNVKLAEIRQYIIVTSLDSLIFVELTIIQGGTTGQSLDWSSSGWMNYVEFKAL